MMKPTLTVACILLKSAWQAVCRPFCEPLRRLSSLRSGSLRSALTALLLTPLAVLHGADLLPLTPAAMTQLDRAQKAGLIEIAPVHLPPPDAADCNHYGWPIATMTGDTIVVMHRRIPGHKAAGACSTSSSTAATPTVLPASFA